MVIWFLCDSMLPPFMLPPFADSETLANSLTGVNQTAGKLQIARMDEMGCRFVETTAHGGARPSHAAWQGQRFHRGGAVDYKGRHYPDFEAATGYGTGEGLCGWNCRHSFYACYPELGDSPAWTREALAALDRRDIPWKGKKYTAYEISQMQRARERNVRRWKKRYLAEDAAGLDATESAVRLKAARQSLADFARATGGRVDTARTGVPGFGRSEGSKAMWAAKITPNDFKIYRGIGARAKNYVVVDKSTGEEYYFVEGTRTQNAQVFAGKGGVKPLREEVAQGLSAEFGGKPEDWQHCKAKGWLDVDGEAVKAEVHWFQNGSEKVKFKVKRWLYDED